MCIKLFFSSIMERKWNLVLLLVVLCANGNGRKLKYELDSALIVRINRYSNHIHIPISDFHAKKWLEYSVAHKYKNNGKKSARAPNSKFTRSNVENNHADKNIEAQTERETLAHFSSHKKVAHALKMGNKSQFDNGLLYGIKTLRNITSPLNLITEHISSHFLKAEIKEPQNPICQAVMMLERYVCMNLSPEILDSLELELPTIEATYAALQRYYHCQELFNRHNSNWKRNLSLLGCSKIRDKALLKLLCKWLQV